MDYPVSSAKFELLVTRLHIPMSPRDPITLGDPLPTDTCDPHKYLKGLDKDDRKNLAGFRFSKRLIAEASVEGRQVILHSDAVAVGPTYRIGQSISRACLSHIEALKDVLRWTILFNASSCVEGRRFLLYAYTEYFGCPEMRVELLVPDRQRETTVIDWNGETVDIPIDEPELPRVLVCVDDARWQYPYLRALYETGLPVLWTKNYGDAMRALHHPLVGPGIRVVFADLMGKMDGITDEDKGLASHGLRTGRVIHKHVREMGENRPWCVIATNDPSRDIEDYLKAQPLTRFVFVGRNDHLSHYTPEASASLLIELTQNRS
jgi:hypothetical protein